MCDLDDIKEKIRAAMESQGTYTEDLDLCITLCAGSYMAFQIALNDISKKRMKSLGLTFQTLSASDDDEVNDLINEVNKIDRDEQGE